MTTCRAVCFRYNSGGRQFALSKISRGSDDRLYLGVVRHLQQAIESGVYPVGSRLPSERELADELGVSRPVIREAIIVLESRGLVQTRHGAGVFVQAVSEAATGVTVESDTGPFEVIEARRLLEGEIAALAAGQVTDRQIADMQRLIARIADKSLDEATREKADRAFHIALARATENDVLADIVEMLWDMRYQSPLCEYFFRRAREAGIEPPVDEHQKVLDALKARNADAARAAMREHLARVTENLLIATEQDVRDRARLRVEERRFHFAERAGLKIPQTAERTDATDA
jgi:GntR family transcriptional repressor for pyruvate dehydrogenase complex